MRCWRGCLATGGERGWRAVASRGCPASGSLAQMMFVVRTAGRRDPDGWRAWRLWHARLGPAPVHPLLAALAWRLGWRRSAITHLTTLRALRVSTRCRRAATRTFGGTISALSGLASATRGYVSFAPVGPTHPSTADRRQRPFGPWYKKSNALSAWRCVDAHNLRAGKGTSMPINGPPITKSCRRPSKTGNNLRASSGKAKAIPYSNITGHLLAWFSPKRIICRRRRSWFLPARPLGR